MKFKYNNQIYVGSREQIIESLKHDLEDNKRLTFDSNEKTFRLGEEEYIILRPANFNVDSIKRIMVQAALDKIPENSFQYNGKTYYGNKEKILKNIEKDLRTDFKIISGVFHTGKESCSLSQHYNLVTDLFVLHKNLIKQALKKVENDI